MAHHPRDRETWRRQGEEYLRRVRSGPPVRSATATAQATRKVRRKGGEGRRPAA